MAESNDVLPPENLAETRMTNQFSDKNLTIQAAVALACGELGISETDFAGRECVATLMEPLTKSGPVSINRLKMHAVSLFRMSK